MIISSWSYDMEGHAKKCVERYCELANKTTQQLYKVPSPCIVDHHFKEEELKSVGELSEVCSQIVLTCLYLARIGRPDFLWSANQLARSITKWTKAYDKRLNRLISYIHHTCECKQYCYVGNTSKQCRLCEHHTSHRPISTVILADCTEMPLFGAHRQTRHFMVSGLCGKSYHEVEESLR